MFGRQKFCHVPNGAVMERGVMLIGSSGLAGREKNLRRKKMRSISGNTRQ